MDEICWSSRSCMFIPTCGVCAEMMTFSLFHDDPLVEPRWSHSSRSAFLDIGLFSCFSFRETFLGCLDLVWIPEITCPMIDDSISPDLWLIVHLMPHWGIFPFRMRFVDLHGVTWSFPLTEYAPRRRFVHYCYDDFSVEPLGNHPVRHALLAIHDVILFPSERCILAWWAWSCYRFGWPGLHICWGMI